MDEAVVVGADQHALDHFEDARARADPAADLLVQGHLAQGRLAPRLGRQVLDRRAVLLDVGKSVERHCLGS